MFGAGLHDVAGTWQGAVVLLAAWVVVKWSLGLSMDDKHFRFLESFCCEDDAWNMIGKTMRRGSDFSEAAVCFQRLSDDVSTMPKRCKSRSSKSSKSSRRRRLTGCMDGPGIRMYEK